MAVSIPGKTSFPGTPDTGGPEKAAKLEHALLSRLGLEEQALYMKVTNEQRIPGDMEREETFAEGFRLGAMMMAEGLNNTHF